MSFKRFAKRTFRKLTLQGEPIETVLIINHIDEWGVLSDSIVLIQQGGHDHWYTQEQYMERLQRDEELQTMTMYMDYTERLYPALGMEVQMYGDDNCRLIEQLDAIHKHATGGI